MSILCTNDGEELFDEVLLEHIRLGNNAEIWPILEGTEPCGLSDSAGKTLLHFAAEYGNEELARYLIDSGAEVDAKDQKKQTPLILAVDAHKQGTIRLLLKVGADMFVPDVNGRCFLGKLFRERSNIGFEFAKTIFKTITAHSLKNSKYVAEGVFHRDCPIYEFIPLNNPRVTSYLLESGSPVDVKIPQSGKTALHLAVWLNSPENVKLLVKWGADVNVKDHLGFTPLENLLFYTANGASTLAIIDTLFAAGAQLVDHGSRNLLAKEILSRGTREMVRLALRYPVVLEFIDRSGKTALHYLSENPYPDILQEVANFYLDVNSRTGSLQTPLHYAAKNGNDSSVRFLLKRGVDANVKDIDNMTPLYLATDQSTYVLKEHLHEYSNCVKILLEHGANPYVYMETFIANNFPNSYLNSLSDARLTLIEPIYAKLALLEASGRPMVIFMRDFIETHPRLKHTFDSVALQLENMKKVDIGYSMTLFDFLTVGENKFLQLTRNRWLIGKLTEVKRDFNATWYYRWMLSQRLSKLIRLVQWRQPLVAVVIEVLAKFCNLSMDCIADKIVDCLLWEKWREIA